MRTTKFFTALLLTLSTGFVLAQPVGNVQISVREAYRAQVKEAIKLYEQPNFEDTTTKKLPVQVEIRSQVAETKFEPEAIKPVMIAGSRLQRLPRHMVRFGFGNYTTPYLEVFTGNDRSKTFNWGVHLRHLSSQTGVRDIVYDRNTFSETSLNVFGKRLWRNYRLAFDVKGDLDRITYYGLPNVWIGEQINNLDFSAGAPLQRYNTIAPSVVFESTSPTPDNFKKAGVSYRYLQNAYNSNENHIALQTDWVIKVKEEKIDVAFNIEHVNTNFVDSAVKFQFTQIQLFPKIKSQYGKLFFDVGLNVNINPRKATYGDSIFEKLHPYVYPHITLDLALVPGVMAAYGGVTGEMKNQNIHVISQMNPFAAPIFGLNPRSTTKIFLGLKGILAKNLSYNIQGYYHNIGEMAIFSRTPDSVAVWNTPAGLEVFYDDISVTGLRGELSFENNSGLRLAAMANFRTIQTADLSAAYHMPNTIIGFEAAYLWRQKIQGNLNIKYIGARTGFDQAENPFINAQLDGFTDVRLGVTYHYNNQLSAFLNVSNLLSSDYELYTGYQVQRLMAMLGITYKL